MALVNNASGVYSTLGYNFSDPNGYVLNLSANSVAHLNAMPAFIESWQAEDIAKIYQSFEDLKRAERVIDFEDVLLLTVGMLEEDRNVRERIRDQYKYFTVDEYQDISPLQQRLINAWLGSRDDICVVGDPAQTIYGFAGATPNFLLNFKPDLTGPVAANS